MRIESSYDLIEDIRAKDTGKLLFRIGKKGNEYYLLIKPKGMKTEYHIPVNELLLWANESPNKMV